MVSPSCWLYAALEIFAGLISILKMLCCMICCVNSPKIERKILILHFINVCKIAICYSYDVCICVWLLKTFHFFLIIKFCSLDRIKNTEFISFIGMHCFDAFTFASDYLFESFRKHFVEMSPFLTLVRDRDSNGVRSTHLLIGHQWQSSIFF